MAELYIQKTGGTAVGCTISSTAAEAGGKALRVGNGYVALKPITDANATAGRVSIGGVTYAIARQHTAAVSVPYTEQSLNNVNITLERYAASSVSGTSATPTASTAVYTATGNFTLDLNSIAGNLTNGQTTVFTARINATADYALSLNIDGVISYIGKGSDVAITSAGLLLNVFISRLDNSTTCIVQASKLS